MDALSIEGAWVFTPRIHQDNRGYFLEQFRNSDIVTDLGYPLELGQVNCSFSRAGVMRGIHFSEVPPGQAKYVACASGAILDVIVDVRTGSPTFGQFEAVPLDDVTRRAVLLEHGLGHAFIALSPTATALYLCSTPYTPAFEHCVHPLDPAIGIPWPDAAEIILSDKDAAAPTLAEADSAGVLPSYHDCVKWADQLRAGIDRAH
jgi:dTDP-4-dehydrorhamnose 3,5-epimerase